MKSPGDRTPTSPEALSQLEKLSTMRDEAKLKVLQLEFQLRWEKQGIADIERKLIALYEHTDVSLKEVADVLDIDGSTVWRKSKALSS